MTIYAETVITNGVSMVIATSFFGKGSAVSKIILHSNRDANLLIHVRNAAE
jgi:hypothetical protein